jgi:hypothetical protein
MKIRSIYSQQIINCCYFRRVRDSNIGVPTFIIGVGILEFNSIDPSVRELVDHRFDGFVVGGNSARVSE